VCNCLLTKINGISTLLTQKVLKPVYRSSCATWICLLIDGGGGTLIKSRTHKCVLVCARACDKNNSNGATKLKVRWERLKAFGQTRFGPEAGPKAATLIIIYCASQRGKSCTAAPVLLNAGLKYTATSHTKVNEKNFFIG
jgi:hypothetical protein